MKRLKEWSRITLTVAVSLLSACRSGPDPTKTREALAKTDATIQVPVGPVQSDNVRRMTQAVRDACAKLPLSKRYIGSIKVEGVKDGKVMPNETIAIGCASAKGEGAIIGIGDAVSGMMSGKTGAKSQEKLSDVIEVDVLKFHRIMPDGSRDTNSIKEEQAEVYAKAAAACDTRNLGSFDTVTVQRTENGKNVVPPETPWCGTARAGRYLSDKKSR